MALNFSIDILYLHSVTSTVLFPTKRFPRKEMAVTKEATKTQKMPAKILNPCIRKKRLI